MVGSAAAKSLMETVREYGEMTTINGVVYVFDDKFSKLSQAFWFLVGFILIAISILLINQGYTNWQDSPILTSVSTTGYPIKNIQFPAITICGLGMMSSVLREAIISQVSDYITINYKSRTNVTINPGETFLSMLTKNYLSLEAFSEAMYPDLPPNVTLNYDYVAEDLTDYLQNGIFNQYSNATVDNSTALFSAFNLSYLDFIAQFQPLVYGCTTVSGPYPGRNCIFPFLLNFKGTTFLEVDCTRDDGDATAWCSVAVDMNDTHIGGMYGYCDPKCANKTKTLMAYKLQQELKYFKNKTVNTTYFKLQGNETFLDLFARYGLNYTDYLKDKLLPFNTEPENILLQQAIQYAKAVEQVYANLTMDQNDEDDDAYKQLFVQNYLDYADFLNEKYPGIPLDMNLTDVIPLLASPQPDAFLQSKLAVTGSYVQSQDLLSQRDKNCDYQEFSYVYEPVSDHCYRLAEGYFMRNQTQQACSIYGESPFQIINDGQVNAFGSLLMANWDNSTCTTSSGPYPNMNCTFPFIYGPTGAVYNWCTMAGDTEPWCSIKVNSDGVHIPGYYGYCNPSCNSVPLPHVGENAFWSTAYRDNITGNVHANTIANDSTVFNKTSTISPYQFVHCPAMSSPILNNFSLRFNKTGGFFNIAQRADTYLAQFICMRGNKEIAQTDSSANFSLLDKLIDPALKLETKATQNYMKLDFQQVYDNIDLTVAYESLFEILWYSQVPCYDTGKSNNSRSMIKRCEWKGVKIDCAIIFDEFPTDRGMCCTFNMAAAEEIFYNTSYQKMISRMQKKDYNGTDKLVTTEVPDFFPKGPRPIPVAGTTKGLSLILDAHNNLLSSGSVSEDYEGFVAIIGSSNNYPLLNQRNLQIRPGHTNLIGISATDVIASDDIRSVNKTKRNCLFYNEFHLKLHQMYSQVNCMLECQMDYARNQTSYRDGNNTIHYCTPWYLPKNDITDICDPWTAQAFTTAMLAVPQDNCNQCLPDCALTTYDVDVTALQFRACDEKNLGVSFLCNFDSNNALDPPIFADQLKREYGSNIPAYATNMDTNIRIFNNNSNGAVFRNRTGLTYDAYEVDIAKVNFYFMSSTVFQFSRDPSMTMTDFIGQVGGFLGLCDGFSLCSAVEIFFWFTFRLWYNATKERPGKGKRGIQFAVAKDASKF